MTTGQTISINNTTYDSSNAAVYHYGGFPPAAIELSKVLDPLTRALQNLTRYDEKLLHMPNSELLLAPLRQRDAVVSSRMEGTISTLEEVLRLEASTSANRTEGLARNDTLEVALYARALKQAEEQVSQGYGLSELLIKNAHQTLLSYGRGAEKSPGQYKSQQNYIGDRRQKRVDFIPISPDRLQQGMQDTIQFFNEDPRHPLLKTAIAHAEFEALHPFEDGNGRVGRMLIPLMLWQQGFLSTPHFFVSDYFEANKDEYIGRLRMVSLEADWDSWCSFFLNALDAQAIANIDLVTRIQAHYELMKEQFRDVLRSQYFAAATDYMFTNPVFWNNHFVEHALAPPSTLRNFTPRLVNAGLLRTIVPPSGRAPGLYAFPSLLELIDAA
ncbi:Fic family protein [uncultured Tateyamaria sp.]|uniref:Fic family protein n=1 Tax=uncultured Tateyamaria sp. TaxID=455651 RepID=UPI00262B083E|nr:Fic family protein [uncultured Tateyamaria sp.]